MKNLQEPGLIGLCLVLDAWQERELCALDTASFPCLATQERHVYIELMKFDIAKICPNHRLLQDHREANRRTCN